MFQVHPQTLNDRINGILCKKGSHESQQLLSKPQEAVLRDWIEFQALIGKPLDKRGIKSLTFEMSGKLPSNGWIKACERRNNVCASKPAGLDPKRAQNFNFANVSHFYQLLRGVYDTHTTIPAQHVWNMDEKGLQLGGGRKRSDKYYRTSNIKSSNFYQIHSDNLELVTVIECVSPSGLSVPPMFVLAKGSIPEIDDSEMDAPISSITTSQNGWTSNEIGLQWFKEMFIPFATAHKVTEDPILLLVDGHDSHETDELRKLAYESNIIVLAFPSKCTHKLQPLDVLVFSQVQCRWSRHCNRQVQENCPIKQHNIIPEYMKVRAPSITPQLLVSAFTCTGIFPFNPNVFTDDDFAPAMSSSITMHAPLSFPADIPSSSSLLSDMSDCNASDSSESCSSSGSDSDNGITLLQLNCDSDSDLEDSDFKPPSSPHCMSTSPHATLLVFPIQLPSLHSTVPLVSPLDSSTSPASATPPAAGLPAASTLLSSFGQPKDLPTTMDGPTRYFTRSKSASPPASVPIALDGTQAPVTHSAGGRSFDFAQVKMTCDLLESQLALANANMQAMTAHCTIMRRAAEDAMSQMEQQKRKSRRPVKTKARYVACPGDPEEEQQFAAGQQEKEHLAEEAAEKVAQKAVEDAAHKAQLEEAIRTQVFSSEFFDTFSFTG
jgi:hypothetical protein